MGICKSCFHQAACDAWTSDKNVNYCFNYLHVITPTEFHLKMLQLSESYGHDPEVCHSKMDELMGELLIKLGYGDGVEVFNKSENWYA